MLAAEDRRYRAMLDAARAGSYALPAINTTSSSTILAALEGFSEAGSDGIIQFSYGAGEFAAFLREEILEDADWAELVDTLNNRLR